jgi:ribosomal protection tetracycline resistance protein
LLRRTLNLGILAHVDAGKTTLTERLLHAAGVIDEIGSVDTGTTQTDSLPLEQQRGITIKSAVVSFEIDDVVVNLIDTPGHPDFIAEVERVLSVLDGAVLVISAVEGVQSQTHILMRALQRLRVPTLIFVNKIDRVGASDERVLEAISRRLTPAIVPLGIATRLGTRQAGFTPWGGEEVLFRGRLAEVLAERDEGILRAYVDDEAGIPYQRLREQLMAQTAKALVHPVSFGSALTGAGVEELMASIAELLPAAVGDADGPVSGTVFKIERVPSGEKIAYVRMFSGTVRTRDRVSFGRDREDKVTAVAVFEDGSAVQRASVSAGQIGKLSGLADVQIGDAIGGQRSKVGQQFAPPTLETVVAPKAPEDRARLRVALEQLAEQDPLIDVRQDDTRREISVSLYGEVQKEVIQATLAADFGVEATFRETTTICVERPLGPGTSLEILQDETNPYHATIGFRVEPAPAGSGVEFRIEAHGRLLPLYIYKSHDHFREAMTRYVTGALREGLHGWQVTDLVVTMTDCGYYVGDGPGKRSGAARTAAGDFRKLTPLVVMQALEDAGTAVCEPMSRLSLEIPAPTLATVLSALARVEGAIGPPAIRDEIARLEAVVHSAAVHELRWQLHALTGGEGVLEAEFGGYEPVVGTPPVRPRTTANPLNRPEYLWDLAGRQT